MYCKKPENLNHSCLECVTIGEKIVLAQKIECSDWSGEGHVLVLEFQD